MKAIRSKKELFGDTCTTSGRSHDVQKDPALDQTYDHCKVTGVFIDLLDAVCPSLRNRSIVAKPCPTTGK